jgi:hypothetical protein
MFRLSMTLFMLDFFLFLQVYFQLGSENSRDCKRISYEHLQFYFRFFCREILEFFKTYKFEF